MLSTEYRAIVKKFLINHFLLGMSNAQLQKRRKMTLWLKHGKESSVVRNLFLSVTICLLSWVYSYTV